MALERRQRDDLVAFVDATSTEHEDEFPGRLRRIQSGERLVRINQISASTTSALALTSSSIPLKLRFSEGGRVGRLTPAGVSGGRRTMLQANPDNANMLSLQLITSVER